MKTLRLKEEISKLKDVDIYSVLLFVLYKLREVPEYSTLSELSYILDKNSLLQLCEFFGGLTITIPTVDELESLVYTMMLYQYVNIDKIPYEKAVEIIGHSSCDLRQVKSDYIKLCDKLSKYDVLGCN